MDLWYSLFVLAQATDDATSHIVCDIRNDNDAKLSDAMREIVRAIPAEFQILCISESQEIRDSLVQSNFCRNGRFEGLFPGFDKESVTTSELGIHPPEFEAIPRGTRLNYTLL